jgi:NDP-sugar pyrophosphorylase family protein
MFKAPDAVVLCGGAGLRLKEITGAGPKSMASVAGRPFLELLLRQLRRHGFERVILAVGYQQELIRAQLGESSHGLRVVYSAEASPLGTGGALRQAVDSMESDTVLVMNGDSYTDADLQGLVREHASSQADATVVVVPADGRNDCGSVRIDSEGRVERFDEKQNLDRMRYLNAGIYMVSRRLLSELASGVPVSLEQVVFPRWLAEGKLIRTFVCPTSCVDIGTPDRYRSAQDSLAVAELETGASSRESQI